jgi:hypothetical protein
MSIVAEISFLSWVPGVMRAAPLLLGNPPAMVTNAVSAIARPPAIADLDRASGRSGLLMSVMAASRCPLGAVLIGGRPGG